MSKEPLKGRCNRCCADITVTLTDELIDNVRASMLDEVISEHESQLRFLKEEGEVAAYTYGFIEAHIEYLKEKYGVK